ncbi:MAG: DNA translocase FtsK [Patescibacteria group bacterium]
MAKRKKRSKKKAGNPLAGLNLNLKKSTIFSIISVALVLFALISVFSFLREGLVLDELNQFYIEFLGPISIFFPFVLILLGLFFTKLKTPLREPNVLVGGILFFLSILGLFRSGQIGLWVWDQVSVLITDLGAFLIFGGGALIGVVVLFNTSIDQLVGFMVNLFTSIKKYLFAGRSKLPKTVFVGDKKPAFESETKLSSSTSIKQGPVSPAPEQAAVPEIGTTAGQVPIGPWQMPPLDLLQNDFGRDADRGDVSGNAEVIEKTLESFGITARVVEVNKGPAVTQYALEVALGTKLSKVTGLSTDLALALAAPTGQIRIEAPIPGRSLVGVEVPNRSSAVVPLKQILLSDEMKNCDSKLAVPLGIDVSGNPRVARLDKMPHVLVAGQTGSGKSILLNCWIATILFRAKPSEVKLILIDPKRVELTRYNDIPHLLSPVIVDPSKVISALKWSINEMDKRYRAFAQMGARNLESYNQMVPEEDRLPFIVIIIDELADIMLLASTEVEDSICRIAQMARATGIHLVLATQRPSVDVLTGLIKANIPSRISCAVSSMTDSRVIIDTPGAEKLLGRGDMLYIPPDQAKPSRIQGALISDPEVGALVDFVKNQRQVDYDQEVTSQPVSVTPGTVLVNGEERDSLFDEAAEIVRLSKKGSASLLQRRLKIGYARAARVLDQLELAGIIGPADGSKPREITG